MENYQSYHSTLPDEDLVRIAYFEIRKIKKEARASAKKELSQRKITNKEIDELRSAIREKKKTERRQKLHDENTNYGMLDFIFDTIKAAFEIMIVS